GPAAAPPHLRWPSSTSPRTVSTRARRGSKWACPPSGAAADATTTHPDQTARIIRLRSVSTAMTLRTQASTAARGTGFLPPLSSADDPRPRIQGCRTGRDGVRHEELPPPPVPPGPLGPRAARADAG